MMALDTVRFPQSGLDSPPLVVSCGVGKSYQSGTFGADRLDQGVALVGINNRDRISIGDRRNSPLKILKAFHAWIVAR